MAKVQANEEQSAVGRVGGFFGRLTNPLVHYFRETLAELRKVTWPTRQEWFNLTTLVMAVMVFLAIVLAGLDLVYTKLLDALFTVVRGGG